jgi:hypothetical protein
MFFIFGDINDVDKYNKYRTSIDTIEAENIDIAKHIFKTKHLFPEQFVYHKCRVSEEIINNNTYYNVKSNSKIPIFLKIDKDNYELQEEITITECIEYDYSFNYSLNLIEDKTTKEHYQIKDVCIDRNTSISKLNKIELRTLKKEMDKTKYDLEKKIELLKSNMIELQSEIKNKIKVLRLFETYIGTHEEVVTLISGKSSKLNSPIYVYQQLLYMDEEVGIWKNGGLDGSELHTFDDWIMKKENYNRYLYHDRCIVAFRVRREEKEYYGNIMLNILKNMEDGNYKTYFLIKNGENIYRIFSNVNITDRLFPLTNEDKHILYNDTVIQKDEKEIKKMYEKYMYGLIAIQGIIDRTDVFDNDFKNKLNLVKGNFTDNEIILIRDDESKNWLDDGKLTWHNFISKNRETINVGTRVLFTEPAIRHLSYFNKDDQWRTYPNKVHYPTEHELLIINDKIESKYDHCIFTFKYNPKDTVIPNYTYSHERKKAVRYKVYRDELINVDNITLEEAEYYFYSRKERKLYLYMLPILDTIITFKKKEQELENEFYKLIQSKCNYVSVELIKEVTQWWKLKNKWKRGLSSDESKAVRMIIKEVNKRSQ